MDANVQIRADKFRIFLKAFGNVKVCLNDYPVTGLCNYWFSAYTSLYYFIKFEVVYLSYSKGPSWQAVMISSIFSDRLNDSRLSISSVGNVYFVYNWLVCRMEGYTGILDVHRI